MHRIHHPTAAAVAPPVDPHATPGFPTAGDPVSGTAPTTLTAWTGHQLIEELVGLVEAAGLTPEKASLTQVRQAVRRLGKGAVTLAAAGATSLTQDQLGLVVADATAGDVTINLPALAGAPGGAPQSVLLARTDATANTVTVVSPDGGALEGLASLPIPPASRTLLMSNGSSQWFVVSEGRTGPGGRAVFVTSGNFVVPAAVRQVRVRLWSAGGGAGGSGTPTNSISSSGAPGAYREGAVAVTPGATIAVTVGAGGAGGAGGGSPGSGTAGGASAFGSAISATGGGQGLAGSGAPQLGANPGGVGTGGDFGVNGQGGSVGFVSAGLHFCPSGLGAHQSQNTVQIVTVGPTPGSPGVFPGGGGGGAALGGAGAPGANGLVIVEW